MPKRPTVKAYKYECDFCHKVTLMETEIDEQPYGVEGNFAIHHQSGGEGGSFYVCLPCLDDDSNTFAKLVDYVCLRMRTTGE